MDSISIRMRLAACEFGECVHVWIFNCACCQIAVIFCITFERRRAKKGWIIGCSRQIWTAQYVPNIFIIYYYYIWVTVCCCCVCDSYALLSSSSRSIVRGRKFRWIHVDWNSQLQRQRCIFVNTHARAHSNNEAKSMGHSQYDMIFGVCVCAHVWKEDMKGNRWIINAFTTSTRITAANGINTSNSPICSGCSGHVHNEKKNKNLKPIIYFLLAKEEREREANEKKKHAQSER